MATTLSVHDDFLSDPGILLRELRTIDFTRTTGETSISVSSKRSRYARSLARRFERMSQLRIEWDWIRHCGRYRTTTGREVGSTDDSFFAHHDGLSNYIAVLYASPPEACHGGTAFYRHKKTGLDGVDDAEPVRRAMKKLGITYDALAEIIKADARTPSKWERTDMVEMRFNRLLVFNGRMFHSHVYDFKKVGKTAPRVILGFDGTILGKRRSGP